MCYSAESSITAWIISVIIASYLWYRNNNYDRWHASFIWTFSAVQLWEAGIWSSDNNNDKSMFVKLIALTLVAQPLVQTIGAYMKTEKGANSPFLKSLATIYLFIFVYTMYRVLTTKFSATTGPNGHLVWKAGDGSGIIHGKYPVISVLYMCGLLVGLLYGLPKTNWLIVTAILTLLFSVSRVSTQEFSSYWCYIAVIYSFVAVLS